MQKPSEKANGTYAVEPPMAKNAKGKPVNAEGKVVKRVMPTDQPLTFWYKRKGYNDFLVSILLCGNAQSHPAKRNQNAFLSSNFRCAMALLGETRAATCGFNQQGDMHLLHLGACMHVLFR